MNARLIQRRLMMDFGKRSFVIPNYTPARWFESDIFEITKAGYFREYEVKMTRADFKADALKYSQKGNKHWMLLNGSVDGPTEFYFVCPEGLIDRSEIPSWAGFFVARPLTSGKAIYVQRLIKAPRLHRKKLDSEIERHAHGVCYWRYVDLWMRKANLQPDAPTPTNR